MNAAPDSAQAAEHFAVFVLLLALISPPPIAAELAAG